MPEAIPDREAVTRLLGSEDVLELFDAHGRAVAEEELRLGHADLVGQRLQPRHVFGGQRARVDVERVASCVVVVGVIHAARDGGVVVAEDGPEGDLAHDLAALVREPP